MSLNKRSALLLKPATFPRRESCLDAACLRRLAPLGALALGAFVSGCGPHVVYQPTRGPVRLAEDVPARIYIKTADGRWTRGANRVLLHEGEYVLDLPPAASSPVK